MSTAGQHSTKNPTIKRILKEASELAQQPSLDYTAAPLENDLFEWHFTLRGAPSPSPFAEGIYHGRIILPPAYPLKPPSFRFLTPSGRFEVNREICLSISGHHEETWQPAWGIRTALVAIRSFMDTDAKGQLGGMDASEEVRKRLSGQSRAWKCGTCAKTNENLMKEQEEVVRLAGGESQKAKEEVPEELRLAYREDLSQANGGAKSSPQSSTTDATNKAPEEASQTPISSAGSMPAIVANAVSSPLQPQAQPDPVAARAPSASSATQPTQSLQQPPPAQQFQLPHDQGIPPWIDKAIYGILAALAFLLWRKLGSI